MRAKLCHSRTFRHLAMLPRFMPMLIGRSHLKCSKPSALRLRDTRLTWDESMACNEKPLVEHSKFASDTRSLIESSTCTASAQILDWTYVHTFIVCAYALSTENPVYHSIMHKEHGPVNDTTCEPHSDPTV